MVKEPNNKQKPREHFVTNDPGDARNGADSDANGDGETRPESGGAARVPGQAPVLGSAPGSGAGEQAGEQEEALRGQDASALEVRELEEVLQRNQEELLRARAELENIRKRAQREVEKAYRYGLEPLVRELLPVLDSMELGVRAVSGESDLEAVREGMHMTLRRLREVLGRFQVEWIEPRPGAAFDPQAHEVVSMRVVTNGGSGSGQKVLEMLQYGCRLDGRLLRAAKVIVSKCEEMSE